MPILEIDFSAPKAPRGSIWTNLISWNAGVPVDLSEHFPNIPAKVYFAASPQVKDPQIIFDGGLVLQTARTDSARYGEVFGIYVDVSALQRQASIRVEVQFDVLQAKRERFWPLISILWSLWGKSNFPWPKARPFLGGLSAVATEADMSAGVIDEDNDILTASTCYITYSPASDSESVMLSAGFFGVPKPVPVPEPMKFFTGAFGPITKDPSAPTNVWDGNPAAPYKLELLLKAPAAPGLHPPQGLGLMRTADGTIFGPPPYLATSNITAARLKGPITSIRYAGANLVVAKPSTDPAPDRNFGPARVRIKKLLVETS